MVLNKYFSLSCVQLYLKLHGFLSKGKLQSQIEYLISFLHKPGDLSINNPLLHH